MLRHSRLATANLDFVQRLLELRCILERQHGLNVIASAFNGDSADTELHCRFREQCITQIPRPILISGRRQDLPD
jgi:hypothetical protein